MFQYIQAIISIIATYLFRNSSVSPCSYLCNIQFQFVTFPIYVLSYICISCWYLKMRLYIALTKVASAESKTLIPLSMGQTTSETAIVPYYSDFFVCLFVCFF